jgi:alpha-1,6-mannosyltransferase
VPTLLFSHERLDAVLAARLPGWLPLAPAADRVNRRLSRLVDRIVISSRFARAEYERIGAGGLRLVPLGVNLDEFRPAALTRPGAGRSVLLVSVGRLSREKRPDRAVEALRLLRSAGVPAGLLVLGDGPMRPALQRSARDLPVRFLGHVPDRRGDAHLLAAADVAVAPSEVEAFGLAVLEALACGTPVVVPDRGAAPELIGPTGSGVITDGTPAGLADGVRSLLDVPERVRRDSARSRAEQYPWSVTVSGLLAAHGLAPTFRAPAWTA